MTQAIVIDPSAQTEADVARGEAQSLLDLIRDSDIIGDDDQALAIETIRRIKEKVERIETTRKFFVEPLNKLVRTYNNFFRDPRDLLQECERALKQKVAEYVRTKNEANQRALAEAAKAETSEQAKAVFANVTPAGNPDGTNIRYRWVFDVVDSDAVPRELCSPDPKKIGQCDPGSSIPGIVWRQEPIVTVRKQ